MSIDEPVPVQARGFLEGRPNHKSTMSLGLGGCDPFVASLRD